VINVEKPFSPEEALEHFGVKGMHWGVRKNSPPSAPLTGFGPDKIVRKTANGDEFTLERTSVTPLHKGLARLSKNYRDSYNNGASMTIKDKDGNKIGNANFWKKSDDELYLNWIDVKKSARGQGYATEVLKAAEELGGSKGFKKMTLEVPGNSPDARHIYENLGFKVVKEDIDPKDPIWGGLTSMEYEFKERR